MPCEIHKWVIFLLDDDDDGNSRNNNTNTKQRMDVALQDVERKLALVESLAVKLSQTSPEAVVGHLLRLHGYQTTLGSSSSSNNNDGEIIASSAAAVANSTTGSTLQSGRERVDRLERQSEVLENDFACTI
jgi:hypothetical protein